MTRIALVTLALAFTTACSGATETETDPDTDSDSDSDTDVDTDSDTDTGGVRFIALMADNDGYSQDEAGDYDDWLVIENTTDHDIDLFDWQLTDDYPNDLEPWIFPSQVIGETLTIWCDDEDEGSLHASFKLSADGETVTLLDVGGNIVDQVAFPAMATDEAYVLQSDGSWALETYE